MAGLERMLQEFEQETWGTNDFPTIVDSIERDEWRKARERMTGMDAEQAEWESDNSSEW